MTKYRLFYLLFFTIIIVCKANNLRHTPNISPREELHDYLRDHNCNNYLLNNILLHSIRGKEYSISYPSLRDMIIRHVPRFTEQEVSRCYQVIIDKFIAETGYRRYFQIF